MRTTAYFRHTRRRPDRLGIRVEWIERVVAGPDAWSLQADGRIRLWGYIGEVDRVLRVVLLEDGETVHNAFFDRSRRRDRR